MVFSSLTFLFAFLPITLILYYLVPKKAKNVVILISGLVFYAWGEPIYVLVMILSTFIDYTAGRIIDKYDDRPKIRTACLLVSLIMNIGLLATFKYLGFIIEALNAGFGIAIPNPNLPLPIGISFFTFQSMSYTIDLYRRQIKVQKNAASFMAFVTLFPQIVAGPIVRYEDIQNEIDDRTITEKMIGDGISRFIVGLGKKVLIANNIGLLWTEIKAMDYGEISAVTAWLGILAFTFQIYFDFSGYSDMAIGLGKMMGFNFPENFNYPYISSSIKEFWRRWHISLSTWFREYLYIPLGGNRKGTAKTYRNKLIVFFFTGLWHGANWTFIVWGLWHGFFIVAEDLVAKLTGKDRHSRNSKRRAAGIAKHLYTLLVVLIGFVIFRADTMSQAVAMVAAMFSGVHATAQTGLLLAQCMTPLTLCALAAGVVFSTPVLPAILHRTDALTQNAQRAVRVLGGAVLLMLLVTDILHLSAASYVPFIYFQF